MINIGKFWRLCLVTVTALACNCAISAEAFIFDNPFLVAIRSEDRVYGYYDSKDERFSCSFFFFGVSKSARLNQKADEQVEIGTYGFDFGRTSFAYKDRDKLFDVPGNLSIKAAKWVVRTEQPQGACNGMGADFGRSANDNAVALFSVEKQIAVVGIGIANKKTFFHLQPGLRKEKRFLLRGDIALIISRRGDYAYVRFANPNLVSSTRDPVITGWIRSADLQDPLPPLAR